MNTKQIVLTLSLALGTASLAACQTSARVSPTTPQATATAVRTGDANAAPMLGKWQGTYEGSGKGKFEIGLTRDAAGKPTGYVAIQPEGAPEFPSIPCDAVTLEGNTLKATFTDWEGAQAQVEGQLAKDELKGTWKTGGGQEGSWQTTKVK